jgi:hypothetical protein
VSFAVGQVSSGDIIVALLGSNQGGSGNTAAILRREF